MFRAVRNETKGNTEEWSVLMNVPKYKFFSLRMTTENVPRFAEVCVCVCSSPFSFLRNSPTRTLQVLLRVHLCRGCPAHAPC